MSQDEIIERLVREVEFLKAETARVGAMKPLYNMLNWKLDVQISADQANYDIGNYEVLFIEPTGANRTIHGFTNGIPGRVLRVMNTSTAFNLLFTHQNAGATDVNRLSTTTIGTITLAPRRWTAFLYVDDVNMITGATRWIMLYPPS